MQVGKVHLMAPELQIMGRWFRRYQGAAVAALASVR